MGLSVFNFKAMFWSLYQLKSIDLFLGFVFTGSLGWFSFDNTMLIRNINEYLPWEDKVCMEFYDAIYQMWKTMENKQI